MPTRSVGTDAWLSTLRSGFDSRSGRQFTNVKTLKKNMFRLPQKGTPMYGECRWICEECGKQFTGTRIRWEVETQRWLCVNCHPICKKWGY